MIDLRHWLYCVLNLVCFSGGLSLRCRSHTNLTSCITSPEGCWYCDGPSNSTVKGCYSPGDLNCSQLRPFYDPLQNTNSICSSFSCPQQIVDKVASSQRFIREERFTGRNQVGFIASSIVQVILMAASVVNCVFMYKKRYQFLGTHRTAASKRVRISEAEIQFYMKFLEWVILLMAFTSALELKSRKAECSWEDKAGCLPLSPDWSTPSGDCRNTWGACCNGLQLGLTGPESTFCQCILAAWGGLHEACSEESLTCYVFFSFLGVMISSVLALLLLHWLHPWQKFCLLPPYCAIVNGFYYVPMYLYPTCGDYELGQQYGIAASILSTTLVIFVLMFVLMWKYDFDEFYGFRKKAIEMKDGVEEALGGAAEMQEFYDEAAVSTLQPESQASPRRPLLSFDFDQTSGSIEKGGLTRKHKR